jgi:hypothetical protein
MNMNENKDNNLNLNPNLILNIFKRKFLISDIGLSDIEWSNIGMYKISKPISDQKLFTDIGITCSMSDVGYRQSL